VDLGGDVELGFSALTRRERLERIARAERDRRAGRGEVAIAALGEATEWPARVIKALARIPESEAVESRRILEEGLDVWAREAGLGSLEASTARSAEPPSDEPMTSEASLDRPIEVDELERAFAEAEAQTDEMHDANRVAERVLMDEPLGLSELSDDVSRSTGDAGPVLEAERGSAGFEVDAAQVDASWEASPSDEDAGGSRSSELVLATLERWLENLDRTKTFRAGRAR